MEVWLSQNEVGQFLGFLLRRDSVNRSCSESRRTLWIPHDLLIMLTPTVVTVFDGQAPVATKTATFGLGPDAPFGAVDGIVWPRVDYAGGSKSDSTDEFLGDHTEVVQVEYDPEASFHSSGLLAASENDRIRSGPPIERR